VDPLVAEAALLALAEGSPESVREQILSAVAQRCGADAVALIGVAPSDREISVLQHVGLGHPPDGLVGASADLHLVDAEHVQLTARVGRGAGSISALLHLSGQRTAVAAGLGRHGVSQVLVAARARGRFDATVAPSLAGVAASSPRSNAGSGWPSWPSAASGSRPPWPASGRARWAGGRTWRSWPRPPARRRRPT